jgi:hypothetical protein
MAGVRIGDVGQPMGCNARTRCRCSRNSERHGSAQVAREALGAPYYRKNLVTQNVTRALRRAPNPCAISLARIPPCPPTSLHVLGSCLVYREKCPAMGPFFRRKTTGERLWPPNIRQFASFSLGHDGRVVVWDARRQMPPAPATDGIHACREAPNFHATATSGPFAVQRDRRCHRLETGLMRAV